MWKQGVVNGIFLSALIVGMGVPGAFAQSGELDNAHEQSALVQAQPAALQAQPTSAPVLAPAAETTIKRHRFLGLSVAYPPARGTPGDQHDEAVLRYFQANRSGDQCALAEEEAHMKLENMFGPNTGVLTEAEVARANPVVKKAINFTALITGAFKIRFQRPRPFYEYAGLVPCISKPWDSYGGIKMSYPSSYASVSTVIQKILIKLYPEKTDLIVKQTNQLCLNRLIGGVHHPSDIDAGIDLGNQIAKKYYSKYK